MVKGSTKRGGRRRHPKIAPELSKHKRLKCNRYVFALVSVVPLAIAASAMITTYYFMANTGVSPPSIAQQVPPSTKAPSDQPIIEPSRSLSASSTSLLLSIDSLLKNTKEHQDDKTKILAILQDANVSFIKKETLQQLPSWSQVSSLYGTDPVMIGINPPTTTVISEESSKNNDQRLMMNQCQLYQDRVEPKDRLFGVAGMLNTGTNLLFQLLEKNCYLNPNHIFQGNLWQVPWGKHNPSNFRLQHFAKGQQKVNVTAVLPVVMVRDPFAWAVSMCHHPYPYVRVARAPDQHCPSLVNNHNIPYPVRIPSFNLTYDSLVGLWNDYYKGYYNDYLNNNNSNNAIPRIMIRMEDLIFHPQPTIRAICQCAGGRPTKQSNSHFEYVVDSSKTKGHNNHKEKNGMIDAMIKYGTDKHRLDGFQKQDIAYAKQQLDPELMQQFAYVMP